MNSFQLVADMAHLASILLLIFTMLRSKSCAGISLRTQVLYALVFLTRYSDLFNHFFSWYNTVMKLCFVSSSLFIIFLILVVFRNSYAAKADNFRVEMLVFISALAALSGWDFGYLEVLWRFSIFLEIGAILPQVFMMSTLGNAGGSITVYYLLLLGLYRAFYMVNWLYKYLTLPYYWDVISWVSGSLQTAIYLYFFYVFWSISFNNARLLVMYGATNSGENLLDEQGNRSTDTSTSFILFTMLRYWFVPDEQMYQILNIDGQLNDPEEDPEEELSQIL